jgi:hypothetical protein
LSYQSDALSEQSRSAMGHNCLKVDGFEPMIVQNLNGYVQLLNPEYFSQPPQVTVSSSASGIKFKVMVRGFLRLDPSMIWERTLDLKKESIEIEDVITGGSRHRVDAFFQLHPDVEPFSVDAQSIRLKLDDDGFCFRRSHTHGGKWDVWPGWYFPEYGCQVESHRLQEGSRLRFPYRQNYLLSLEGGRS